MLKSIARVFEFKETSISKSTLRRITIALSLSIPAFPLAVMRVYELFPNPIFEGVAVIFIIIGVIGLIYCLSTRFVNRFYFPDKYLDEWEIGIKHKSMAFTFMIMFWVVPLIVAALAVFAASMGSFDIRSGTSGLVVFYIAAAILLGLCYVQIFHALWQVRPFDED